MCIYTNKMDFISQIFFSKKILTLFWNATSTLCQLPSMTPPFTFNVTMTLWENSENLNQTCPCHTSTAIKSCFPSYHPLKSKSPLCSVVVNSICMCKCHLCFNARKKIKSSSSSCQNKLQTVTLSNNPFTPKSDQHLISHCNIIPKSLIKVPTIKEMISS